MFKYMMSFANLREIETTHEKEIKRAFWYGFSVGLLTFILSFMAIYLFIITEIPR